MEAIKQANADDKSNTFILFIMKESKPTHKREIKTAFLFI